MNRKFIKTISVVACITMIFSVLYAALRILSSKTNILSGVENKEFAASNYYGGDTHETINRVESGYQIPDVTVDQIIAEACKYKSAQTWTQASVGYNDAWNPAVSIENKTQENIISGTNQWRGYNISGMDCSGMVYATLRHLGIRLTGFCDGSVSNYGRIRLGPVPLAPYGWMDYNSRLPYHVKWINGQEIAKITDFTQREHYDKATKSYVIDCTYYDWIERVDLAPGSMVVSPPASGEHGHMWIYIGKYENQEAIKTYLTSIGVDLNGLRIENDPANPTSQYWSIECRGTYNGMQGVVVTNRDPACANGQKKGSGYVGFTLFDQETTPGKFSMDISKLDRDTGEALEGAVFHFEDRNTKPTTIYDDKTTGTDGKVTLIGEQTFNEAKTYVYSVMENTPPDGYGSDNKRHFGINVVTKIVNEEGVRKSVVDYVLVWGNKVKSQDGGNGGTKIYPGETKQYSINDEDDDPNPWSNDGEVKEDTMFIISLQGESDNAHIALAWANTKSAGSFRVKLTKLKAAEGDENPETLNGARFWVRVFKEAEGNRRRIYSGSDFTRGNGTVTFSGIPIDDPEAKYEVYVTETSAPDGYIGIEEAIKFPVTVVLDEEANTYKLVPEGDITGKTDTGYEVSNAKKVDVKENEILIDVENRTTSIDIHKGVKTVENQDSGYFAIQKAIEEAVEKQAEEDAEVEPTYEDENTGVEYTEEELKDIAHEWVVETTIPDGVTNYKRYLVNDPIDTTKLVFAGLDRVKVELIDAKGNVIKQLVEDEDYVAEYDDDVLCVSYIDKKQGNTFYGKFLTQAAMDEIDNFTSCKIRLTFYTTFKINPETGKLAVLDGVVTNAENKATLVFDNGSGNDQELESENPEVHTGAVSIFKYEDANGNGKHDEGEKALVGAEFKIALSEEDAKNGRFVKIGGEELVAVSNEHGIATFVGLSFGGDAKDDEKNLVDGTYKYDWETASRDYYIVETKTPEGYEKVTDVLKTTVSKNSSEIIDITDKINEMDSIGNKPLKFDLALRKWVTHAYVTENGQTVEYKTGHKAEDDPEAVVKVDLKKSKLNNVTVKFKYSIRITNEGEIAGEAREITDYIPAGLKFVQEDNPDWTTTSDERIVKTRKLEGVTLQPGESAEVEIMLTWVNSKDSMGVMTNTAEISEDYNEYGVHDIDSTPNNKKAGEDDIDDAPVMLAIKTGSEVVAYASVGLGFVTVVTIGAIAIRRKFASI